MTPQKQQDGDQLVSQQDLDKILNNIQNLAQSGSKEMAERMLSELKDILERLQTGNLRRERASSSARSTMMKDLSDLVSNQQKLLDETFDAKREQGGSGSNAAIRGEPARPADGIRPRHVHGAAFGMPGEAQQGFMKGQGELGGQGSPRQPGQLEMGQQPHRSAPGQDSKLGERQQELRDPLQSLIDRFRIEGANAPEQFQGAEEAMGDAKDAIGEDNLDRATQQQSLALDQPAQGRPVDGRADDGERRGAGRTRPRQ